MQARIGSIGGVAFCVALLAGVISGAPSAQAWPSNATDAANCHAKDGKLLGRSADEFGAFSKKYKNFDEEALKKDPKKYCKWLTDTVFELRKRNMARLEARLKDDHCGPDILMVTNYEYGSAPVCRTEAPDERAMHWLEGRVIAVKFRLATLVIATLILMPAGRAQIVETYGNPTGSKKRNRKQLTPAQRDEAQQLFERAFDHYQAGQFEAAIADFERGRAIDPANTTALSFLADALARNGDTGRARLVYDKVIVLEPDSDNARKAKAAIRAMADAAPRPAVAQAIGGAAAPLTAERERALKPKEAFKECDQCPGNGRGAARLVHDGFGQG